MIEKLPLKTSFVSSLRTRYALPAHGGCARSTSDSQNCPKKGESVIKWSTYLRFINLVDRFALLFPP